MDKCKRCHCKRTEDDFYKNGKRLKTCYFCRAYNKNYRRRKGGDNIINEDDFKCPRCNCKRTEDDFYKNGKKMKTCDLCRKYNKAFHEKRKNQKRCLTCNVFKDKDKCVFKKITYDSCIACERKNARKK